MKELPNWTNEEVEQNLALSLPEAISVASRFIPGLGKRPLTFGAGVRWCVARSFSVTNDPLWAAYMIKTMGVLPAGCYIAGPRIIYVNEDNCHKAQTIFHEIGHVVLHVGWPDVERPLAWFERMKPVFEQIVEGAQQGTLRQELENSIDRDFITSRNGSANERQADAVGLIAIAPHADGMTAEELQQRFNLPPRLAELRVELTEMNWKQSLERKR